MLTDWSVDGASAPGLIGSRGGATTDGASRSSDRDGSGRVDRRRGGDGHGDDRPRITGWDVHVRLVPAAARRLGSPGRPRHRPGHPDRGCWRSATPSPGGPAPLGTAAARRRTSPGSRGCSPSPSSTGPAASATSSRALRVPANRSTHLRPACDVGGVRQSDPRGRPGPLARARRRPPARGADLLRGAGPARARQRLAAGLVVTAVAATDRGGRARHGAGARRRGPRATAAPFLVLGPAAVWQCVSADAMFAAVAAWGTVRPGRSARSAGMRLRLVGARRAASRLRA